MATIRELREDDISVIVTILNQSFQALAAHLPKHFIVPDDNVADEQYLRSRIGAADGLCLAAQIGDSVIGYLIAYGRRQPNGADFLRARRVLWVDDIAVETTYRRQGVGSELLRTCEERARVAGYDEVQLDFFDFNLEAAAFYGSQSYRYLKHTLRKDLDRRRGSKPDA